ncbi:hypothetical protein AVEN_173551-1 [Araneus ventricosus]|uniref:Uncharacterized protein n=1 Tax=Araneus ventricosus TaxID=182803 RepID=A0A4Y2WE25_ARAVE|nr:hypothetical protein AVEN_60043-1 [Araneus ventricosus]GBO34884.1 hypothetical protein AVEN_173551-1 [Araneus ventricosus]
MESHYSRYVKIVFCCHGKWGPCGEHIHYQVLRPFKGKTDTLAVVTWECRSGTEAQLLLCRLPRPHSEDDSRMRTWQYKNNYCKIRIFLGGGDPCYCRRQLKCYSFQL